MEPGYPPQAETFRQEVRRLLEEIRPVEPLPPPEGAAGIEAHRAWERRLHAAGLTGIDWPVAYGGAGRDVYSAAVFLDEYARARLPERLNTIGLEIVGPTLITEATPSQRAWWLPAILRCDEMWALALSEPEAGSDLLSLTTSAQLDGDVYRVRGRKIWTSMAQWSQWLLTLVRTGEADDRRAGLTMLAIPADAAGVTIEPIRQIHGRTAFCEVTFDDVHVEQGLRVGADGDGWSVAQTIFSCERGTISSPAQLEVDLEHAVRMAVVTGAWEQAAVRAQLAMLHARVIGYRSHLHRALATLAAGRRPGVEASVTKLIWSQLHADIMDAARDAAGADLIAVLARVGIDYETWDHAYWQARAGLIYGGASEVQRDLVSRQILQLPR